MHRRVLHQRTHSNSISTEKISSVCTPVYMKRATGTGIRNHFLTRSGNLSLTRPTLTLSTEQVFLSVRDISCLEQSMSLSWKLTTAIVRNWSLPMPRPTASGIRDWLTTTWVTSIRILSLQARKAIMETTATMLSSLTDIRESTSAMPASTAVRVI